VLSRAERDWLGSAEMTPRRRRQWLIGRSAAKDAIRRLLREAHGLELHPADVSVLADEHGRPVASGRWRDRLGFAPALSIAHVDGLAVALAVLAPDVAAGIDVERLGARPEGLDEIAFNDREAELLARVGPEDREEWALRFWCAKESAGKALGQGLAPGLRGLEVRAADRETGRLTLELGGEWRARFPQLRDRPISSHTARDGDRVTAATLITTEA
jgi:phosphopantetheinyl transferase